MTQNSSVNQVQVKSKVVFVAPNGGKITSFYVIPPAGVNQASAVALLNQAVSNYTSQSGVQQCGVWHDSSQPYIVLVIEDVDLLNASEI
jgi:hypothetical protein